MARIDERAGHPGGDVALGYRVDPLRRVLLSIVLVAASAALVACGDDDEDGGQARENRPAVSKGTFVGKVGGTDAYVALVSDGKRVIGYVCDSKRVSSWIDVSTVRDGKAMLISRAGDPLGEATVSADGVSGEVTVGGERRSFSAARASGEAGLYRAARAVRKDGELRAGEVEVGWVVLADGSQRGVFGVGTKTGTPMVNAAPRLAPNATNVSVPISARPTSLPVTNVRGITPIPIP